MPCYHPKKLFYLDGFTHPVTGNTLTKYAEYEVSHIELRNGKFVPVDVPSVSNYRERSFYRHDVIPCGKCNGCLMDRSRQWANRCMLERTMHDESYFITLTYNAESVPVHWHADASSGEATPILTLDKSHLQMFWKNVRNHLGQCRYLACGEYGSRTHRPHYHAIVFGLHLDDLQLYSHTRTGGTLYTSQALSNCWSKYLGNDGQNNPIYAPYGNLLVADCTWESCAYVARYTLKKAKSGQTECLSAHNIQPEFSTMSRKPGIGRPFYDACDPSVDIYAHDSINISTKKGGKQFKPPKYFDDLYSIECPEDMERIKTTRKEVATALQDAKLERTDLPLLQLLAVEEQRFQNKISMLKRSL